MNSLSVNLEYMFQEAGDDLAARARAAADAGFNKVEVFWTHDKDLESLGAALEDTGVRLWTVLVDPRTAFAMFDRLDYSGAVGIECYPTLPSTADALAYIHRVAAGEQVASQ